MNKIKTIKKIKTVSKYVMNILAFINAIIVGLSPIWGWDLDKVTKSIVVITGAIGFYLVGDKVGGKVGGKLFETAEPDPIKMELQSTFNEGLIKDLNDEGVVLENANKN